MSGNTPAGLDLPGDILDRIFQCLSTLATLSAAKLVSKTWYCVFQAHPKSIMRSITMNAIGPVAEAIRVVHHFRDDGENVDIHSLSEEEYHSLQQNAAVVRKLEEVFSRRRRDFFSRTSQLTETESWRFARAIYRIMLYCAVFRMPTDEEELNDLEEHQRSNIEAQRAAMLRDYPTQELRELTDALAFLRAIANESDPDRVLDEDDDFYDGNDMLISTGPANALRAHQARKWDIMLDALQWREWSSPPLAYKLLVEYFTGPLQKISYERAISYSTYEPLFSSTLLDAVTYRSAPCDQCRAVKTRKLRGQDDWAELHLDMRRLLPRDLAASVEMKFLDNAPPERDSYKLMSELFALKTKKFVNWNKSDALCNPCLIKFVSAHLHLWLLARKLNGQ